MDIKLKQFSIVLLEIMVVLLLKLSFFKINFLLFLFLTVSTLHNCYFVQCRQVKIIK